MTDDLTCRLRRASESPALDIGTAKVLLREAAATLESLSRNHEKARARRLRIKGCSDSQMWYAGLVGTTVPLIREEQDCYISREPEGYVNIVRKRDAEIVL